MMTAGFVVSCVLAILSAIGWAANSLDNRASELKWAWAMSTVGWGLNAVDLLGLILKEQP